MKIFGRQFTYTRFVQGMTGLLLFVLPWQTFLIIHEQFLNGAKWEYGTLGLYATEILFWIVMLLFAVWYAGHRDRMHCQVGKHLSKERQFLFMCALFVIYAFVSLFWALDFAVAIQHAVHILEAFLFFCLLLYGPLRAREIILCFVGGSLVQAGVGIWQFLTQTTVAIPLLGLVDHAASQPGTSIVSSMKIGRWLRAYAGFSHPNVFAGYLVVALFFLTMLRHIQKKRAHRVLMDVIFIVHVFALFFAFSRAAWIAFALIIFWNAIFISWKHQYNTFQDWVKSLLSHVVLPVIVLIILTLLYFPLIATRTGAIDSPHEFRSVDERLTGYEEAIALFEEQPVLGYGLGNYTAAVYEESSDLPGWEYQPVHNVFFLLLVEGGIVGILLMLGIGVTFCRYQHAFVFFSHSLYVVASLGFFLVLFLSLAVFDHYLFSSYIGLMLSAVFFAVLFRAAPQVLHK